MTNKVERLQEIQQQIKALLGEAEDIVDGTSEEQRAKSYWIAHMRMALDDDHSYLGSGGVTMQDTIESLGASEDGEDEAA